MGTTLEQLIHNDKRQLENPYAHIERLEEIKEIRVIRRQLENPCAFADELDSAVINVRTNSISYMQQDRFLGKTDSDIEHLARRLQIRMWHDRDNLFQDKKITNPVDTLSPIIALNMLGYTVEAGRAVGQLTESEGRTLNIAGLIDKKNCKVFLSGGYPPIVRNFTAAHELGHACMHEFVGMHRDKPLDGSARSSDPQEREADKFAAYFLMPAKLVKNTFERIFYRTPFVLDDAMRFALHSSLPNANWKPIVLRDLSRVLSAASGFNGLNFIPLFKQFRVSKEAMAIRLEEIGLVIL